MANENVETAIGLLEEIRDDLRKITAGAPDGLSIALTEIDGRLEEVQGVLFIGDESS